jgi:hypothetical protein
MMEIKDFLHSIFPSSLSDDLDYVAAIIPDHKTPPVLTDYTPVKICGELLQCPARIYNPVIYPDDLPNDITKQQILILNCFYTRSRDGHIREYYLKKIIESDQDWVTPFVFYLCGEYVLEIGKIIESHTERLLSLDSYHKFACDNPKFIKLLKRKATSYWSYYHHHIYKNYRDYPAVKFLRECEAKVR